ncbi:MAG: electron transport complex subunit E [Youngiibacter sp.]|nr:electron transport complex subunit E [Youngiibacter sp.]
MGKYLERIKNGLFTENTIYVQLIAMCPTLAVSTSVKNAIGMGIAATAVLIFSNLFISLLRNFIPDKVRIPAYIVIIAGFVSAVDMLMAAYTVDLYNALGIFIPLIVVNCVILGRAEAYANKNKPLLSIFDGIGMGLGFTLALLSLGVVREILGAGTLLGIKVTPDFFEPANVFILPPGAFLTMGVIMAYLNSRKLKKGEAALKLHDDALLLAMVGADAKPSSASEEEN